MSDLCIKCRMSKNPRRKTQRNCDVSGTASRIQRRRAPRLHRRRVRRSVGLPRSGLGLFDARMHCLATGCIWTLALDLAAKKAHLATQLWQRQRQCLPTPSWKRWLAGRSTECPPIPIKKLPRPREDFRLSNFGSGRCRALVCPSHLPVAAS